MFRPDRTSTASATSSALPPASRNSDHAMRAIAPPPTPLNSATICGIAVIFTLRAAGTPIAVPITSVSAKATKISRNVGTPCRSNSPSRAMLSISPSTSLGGGRMKSSMIAPEKTCQRPMKKT